ncbi:hypothetical protein PG999_008740 [Apiospora kogelbergensis]|uniref:Uncharacterized protein n=1 Tax=Apiospora kogelbergensis TaxID=1337665 RepID=A0AAW0QSS2_9PEZI
MYQQIWRLGTAKALYADGTRPRREREILYGAAAQIGIRSHIQRINTQLRRINAARRRMDEEGRASSSATDKKNDGKTATEAQKT